jgi:hypothetical protein
MRGMRVSQVARYLSFPSITFSSGGRAAHKPRLGLIGPTTVFHGSRRSITPIATVGALRPETSRFRFPAVGRPGRARTHRRPLPQGLPRANRT